MSKKRTEPKKHSYRGFNTLLAELRGLEVRCHSSVAIKIAMIENIFSETGSLDLNK